ncbi:class I SAM-dependent methyltransferase [Mesorhizobium sp. BR1-1-2]|uniref:class I SAM-dependent methyltransferase n=1 Tax=Mesorhizobium sp. BR1-1-2 TaxID=2876652 RepID=UPI001CCCCBB5|nr:class I SAM-dependent methyltransferase [Mesorhizobium sp. BR1-1-2]MBZ9967645.1 class I SAM-dependent methyltransferase [Mesorhizobium sp. BR1-1-2]
MLRNIARRLYLGTRRNIDTRPMAADDYLKVQYRGDKLEYVLPRVKIISTVQYLIRFLEGRRPPSSILDAGARDGWTVSLFNQLGLDNVTGVELIEPLVAHAKANGRNVVQGDLHELPFADGSFGLVFCRHTLEHTMDPKKAMRELARVCEPGGIIFITLPIERNARGKHTVAIPNLRLLKQLALDAAGQRIDILKIARSAETRVIIPDGDEALLILRKKPN